MYICVWCHTKKTNDDTTSFKGTTNNSKHACVYCKDIILNGKVNVNS